MSLNLAAQSRLMVVIPLSRESVKAAELGTASEWRPFSRFRSGIDEPEDPTPQIAADVNLGTDFLGSIQQRQVDPVAHQSATIDIGIRSEAAADVVDSAADTAEFDTVVDLTVEVVRFSWIGTETYFLVVGLRPRTMTSNCWLEVARMASKSVVVTDICTAFGVKPAGDNTRGVIVASFQVAGEKSESVGSGTAQPAGIERVAQHLATRAPVAEEIARTRGLETKLSEAQHMVVTRRTCGFVTADLGSSKFFEKKFPLEIEGQYLLAVLLATWQLLILNGLVTEVNAAWKDVKEKGHDLRGSVKEVNRLRDQYARFVGTSSLGPVFDSRTQATFWAQVQTAFAVRQRADEVKESLSALGQTMDIRAGMRVEGILAFFTLVIGVPSLAFTVLGVNIDRLTSDSGLSGLWAALLFAGCVAVGAASYFYMHGFIRWDHKSGSGQKSDPVE